MASASFWAVGWLSILTTIALTYSYWPNTSKSSFLNPEHAYAPPFQSAQSILGTDQLGRDLLFYLLHACQTAWFITFPPLIIATAFGLFLGFLAGYYGNSGLHFPLRHVLLALFILCASMVIHPLYQWCVAPWLFSESFGNNTISLFLFGAFWVALFFLLNQLGQKRLKKVISVPIDLWVTRAIDIWSTLPKLLLLLLLSAFTPPSLWSLMGWIAISFWVLPARLTRSKVRELKSEPFIEAAQAMGLSTKQIFLKHFGPSLKGPLLTNFCFSASGLLGIGASLAYLGIGLPPEDPSWGKMLSIARFSVTAWWLLFFPALFLLLSIFSLQTLGHKFSSKHTS